MKALPRNVKERKKFDTKAKSDALRYAKENILNELGEETRDAIADNYGDVNTWLITQIESTIYKLKKYK